MDKIDRRSALRALALAPLAVGMTPCEKSEIPFAGVEQTPELIGKVRIFLDGKELKTCIWADANIGIAEVFVEGSNGLIVLDKDRTAALRKRLRGTVRIERK